MIKTVYKIVSLIFLITFSDLGAVQNVLDQNDVILVDSLGSNKICFHRNMFLVDSSYHSIIVNQIKQGIHSINTYIQVSNVEFRVLVFPERTIPRLGMSGAAPNKHEIYLLLNPDHEKVYNSIENHIPATLAHEYHHTLRYRTVGYGDNLFEAIISEGLADHFALQVIECDTLAWQTTLPDSEYFHWKNEAKKIWFKSDYDHLAWFIGLNSDIPRGTAYDIGFRIIAEYLSRHQNVTAATLYDKPAKHFLTE